MFTGESKYGYQDGEHFANWGETYPLFARVVGGQLYAVAREENTNWGPERFFHMFTMSREWLKNAVFADHPTDADLFTDKPNVLEDSSVPANQFIKSADNKTQVLKRPNSAAAAAPPVVTPVVVPPATTTGNPVMDPAKPPATTPTTTGTTTVPTGNLPINLATVTGTSSSTPNWLVIALVALAAVAIVGVIIFKKKKGK